MNRLKLLLSRLMLALVLVSTPMVVSGCGASLAAIFGTITSVALDSLAILSGIDSIVQEYFRRHPDIPMSTRQAYVALYDRAVSAARAIQHSATGAKALTDDDVKAALAAFNDAYQEIRKWLASNRMLEGETLMLDGVAIRALEEPPAVKALHEAEGLK